MCSASHFDGKTTTLGGGSTACQLSINDYIGWGANRSPVLVVDDDDGVRTAVTWALEADGFEVIAVENGLAAIHAIESSTLSLVVLDLSLPGLGGLDILNRVRTTEAREGSWRLPIIVLSGRDTEMDRIVGLVCRDRPRVTQRLGHRDTHRTRGQGVRRPRVSRGPSSTRMSSFGAARCSLVKRIGVAERGDRH